MNKNKEFLEYLLVTGKIASYDKCKYIDEVINSNLDIRKIWHIKELLCMSVQDVITCFKYMSNLLSSESEYEEFLSNLKEIVNIYRRDSKDNEVLVRIFMLNLMRTLINETIGDIDRLTIGSKILFSPNLVPLDKKRFSCTYHIQNSIRYARLIGGIDVYNDVGTIWFKNGEKTIHKIKNTDDMLKGLERVRDNIDDLDYVFVSIKTTGYHYREVIDYILGYKEEISPYSIL